MDAVRLQDARALLYDSGHAADLHRFDDEEVLTLLEQRYVVASASAPVLRRLVVQAAGEAAAASTAVTPSQLVPRRQEVHWVQFNVADKLGNPVGGLPYKLVMPGGSSEKDTLPLSGKIRKDDAKVGTYTLELGELRSAGWEAGGSATRGPLPVKTALTLTAQSRHVPPGTAAKFKVFRLYDEEPGRAVGTADGKVEADGSISASFTYTPGDDDLGREVALIHSCTIGKLWIKSSALTLSLPRLVAPRWSADELTVGDTATLSVDCPGIADGESVHFTLCRADTGASIAELDATVGGEKAQVQWDSVDPDPETAETELYFDAACAGLGVRSRTARLADDVELVFEGEDGTSLANTQITLEFGDGTRRIFETDASGALKLTDPRARTARVIVAGAEEADVVEQG